MPLVDTNGTKLFYDLSGPDGAPVVVFSNSIGTTMEMWDHQVRALCDRFRCLRYDTRGHGRSSVVDDPVSIETLADDLAGLLDALGIASAHVVGLSLGGMTAQAFALRHSARVESLVLMATSAHLPTQESWDARAQAVREGGMAAIVEMVMPRWFTPETTAQRPDRVRFLRERFLALEPEGYAVCCGAIGRMDLRGSISAIEKPTLVIAGAGDPATPVAMSEQIKSRIAGAELVVVPEAAHQISVEQPEAVNALLEEFLTRVAGAQPRASGGQSFVAGVGNRKAVLGVDHVQRSLERAGEFALPWQDFITRYAWGEIWGDPNLPWKTRSLVTLAMMVALHREEEFKLHLRPALKNGVTLEELRALLLHTAIYGGVPAANAAFRWAKEVLGDEADQVTREPVDRVG
jgi:3-oxoadipate enol-lactonase/4-carboxymuconolactone decarboxylase